MPDKDMSITSPFSASIQKSAVYQAYLLRFWRGGEEQPWRASLIQIGADTHEPMHFPDTESLFDLLRAQIEQAHVRTTLNKHPNHSVHTT